MHKLNFEYDTTRPFLGVANQLNAEMETRKPRVVAQFTENGRVAVVLMQCADNRVNPEFIRDFNNALDEVERLYSIIKLPSY